MTATPTSNPGVMAVTDIETAGAIVWWRLNGETDETALEAAWTSAGLDPKLLPASPTAREAVARALRELSGKRMLVRPLDGQKGYALVREQVDATGTILSHKTVITATLAAGDVLRMEAEPELTGRLAQVQALFDHYRSTLVAGDVSEWIADLVKLVKAVSLREMGGVYFIPQDQVAPFRAMVGALKSVSSHLVYEVPALKSTEAIEAILDAVLMEADGEVQSMEADIAGGELGERALTTRTARCESLREKVKSYEALLGRSMDAVHQRIEGLEAKITSAVFAAQAASDSQQGAA